MFELLFTSTCFVIFYCVTAIDFYRNFSIEVVGLKTGVLVFVASVLWLPLYASIISIVLIVLCIALAFVSLASLLMAIIFSVLSVTALGSGLLHLLKIKNK